MKQILCFGDSNTYGLIPGSTRRFKWEQRWTGRLEQKLGRDFRMIEEGLCGRTTVFEDALRSGRKGCTYLPVLLETHAPLDGVILMLGTNDCKAVNNASAKVIGKGIEKLILQIRAFSKEIPILLISPILLGETVWKKEFDSEFDTKSVVTARQLKEEYQKIAEQYGCWFLAASEFTLPSNLDLEHLDEVGHQKLADAIYEKGQGFFTYGS